MINTEFSVWVHLKCTDKPIILYGMGDGADKILEVFNELGIKADGIFASDSFVRHQNFRGMTVCSYDEICGKFDDFIVIVAFATSLCEVIDNIRRISKEHETYAPDVNAVSDGNPLLDIFTPMMYYRYMDKISALRGMLSDDISLEVLDGVINYKLSGKIEYLDGICCDRNAVWKLLKPERIRAAADLGAYTGDTVRELMEYCAKLESVYALEPDERTFRKLSVYADVVNFAAESEKRCGLPYGKPHIYAHKLAAWDKSEALVFDERGGRNSRLGSVSNTAKHIIVDADSLDNVLDENCCDYIKFDVEGAESRAVDGCANTIAKYSPDIALSLYHHTRDLWELPEKLYAMCGKGYNYYLRRPHYIPAWDLTLYAVKK